MVSRWILRMSLSSGSQSTNTLQVHHVAQLAVDERHDSLDYYHRLGLHMYGFGQAVADEVAVGGLLDGTAVPQLVDLLDEQLPVEGVGMVEVDGLALLVGEAGGVVIV